MLIAAADSAGVLTTGFFSYRLSNQMEQNNAAMRTTTISPST